MQTRRAFALRDSIDADTFGGSVALPDGSTFRVDDALVEGGGIIVTDDVTLISALDGYIALRSVAVPKELAGYDGMNVEELDAEIAARGDSITLPDSPKKADKIAALIADDARIIDEQTATDAAAAEASIVTNDGGAEGSDS